MNHRRGPADYLKLGSYNAICDRCGRKFKAEDLSRTWDGLYVCESDYETRHPQDFVRGEADPAAVPWSRSRPEPTFTSICTLSGRTAWADLAVADCAIANLTLELS